jgi:hypothetical protein
MPNKYPHPEVPATKENCEADFQDKLKLNEEFEKFKKLLVDAAKSSQAVEKLVVPLNKLEKAMNIAAHGRHLVPRDEEGEQS